MALERYGPKALRAKFFALQLIKVVTAAGLSIFRERQLSNNRKIIRRMTSATEMAPALSGSELREARWLQKDIKR